MIILSVQTNAGNTQENFIAEDRPLGWGPFKHGREALVRCNAGRAVAAGTAMHSRGDCSFSKSDWVAIIAHRGP